MIHAGLPEGHEYWERASRKSGKDGREKMVEGMFG
jgi:hypothetical protein